MTQGRTPPRKNDIHITIYQLVVLLSNYNKAINHPAIGHLDADMNIKDMLARFKRERIHLSVNMLEKLLYSVNMLKELGEYWHPTNEPFDKFCYDLIKTHKFDKEYNKLVPKIPQKE